MTSEETAELEKEEKPAKKVFALISDSVALHSHTKRDSRKFENAAEVATTSFSRDISRISDIR